MTHEPKYYLSFSFLFSLRPERFLAFEFRFLERLPSRTTDTLAG